MTGHRPLLARVTRRGAGGRILGLVLFASHQIFFSGGLSLVGHIGNRISLAGAVSCAWSCWTFSDKGDGGGVWMTGDW
jgi:hypothetical protein